MRLAARSKLSPIDFLGLLPAIADLIGDVVDMVRDGKVTAEEITAVGTDLIAIVQAVVGRKN
jgi:hypothetical protein